ncbi:MAG: FAD-dependent oxidoreductase [SAR86 cluster bacterium]|nr:FAD-dependent oxidoreductase [SAR86 cluster bacterium]
MKIAIIGAGLSGLTAAINLDRTADITLFEKSRRPGGRICTRYVDSYNFDHGAQFFTARSAEFKEFLKPLIKSGVVDNWKARWIEVKDNRIISRQQWSDDLPRYVGVPSMSVIGKYLSKNLNIKLNTEVSIQKSPKGWKVVDCDGEVFGHYDWVISSIPAEQSLKLLPNYFSYHDALKQKKMFGCYSLMLGFDEALDLDWDAAQLNGTDISWIAVNSSKPGRSGDYSLLVHSTNDWAEEHLDDDVDTVKEYLCSQVAEIIGQNVYSAQHVDLHRWRYANIPRQDQNTLYIDSEFKLSACGDWCKKGRIEEAFRSGFELAKEMNNLI